MKAQFAREAAESMERPFAENDPGSGLVVEWSESFH